MMRDFKNYMILGLIALMCVLLTSCGDRDNPWVPTKIPHLSAKWSKPGIVKLKHSDIVCTLIIDASMSCRIPIFHTFRSADEVEIRLEGHLDVLKYQEK